MTGEELRQAKQRLRREIRIQAARLTEKYRREASERIVRQVLSLPAYRKARTVMAYVSLPGEPDTRLILEDAAAHGKTVLLPRCTGPDRMEALRFPGWDKMEKSRMGIPEPPLPADGTKAPEPDLILVPCVAASPGGIRLGHGAGYYDRFLAEHSAKTICLCFRKLLRSDLPAEMTDISMDYVISD